MKIAILVLAGTAALTIVSSGALAQQARAGIITEVNRIDGIIAIKPTSSATVGASTGSAAEQFKVQAGLSLDDWHAGDDVTYSATDQGGVKTITKLQKQ